jgi:hypothetical protein
MDESVFHTKEGKSRNIPYGGGQLRKNSNGSSNDNHYDYGRQILKDKPLGTNQHQGFTTAAPKRLAFSYVKILGWSSIHTELRSGRVYGMVTIPYFSFSFLSRLILPLLSLVRRYDHSEYIPEYSYYVPNYLPFSVSIQSIMITSTLLSS